MGQNRMLTVAEQSAWRSFLLAHDRLFGRLDADLIRECDMTLAEYEVLLHLAEAEEHQLRMNELADLSRLSPSGLTRRFDALVRRGWVSRERCDDDRRGIMAQLTEEGLKRVRGAEPVHDAAVREHCFAILDGPDVTRLGELMTTIAYANASDGDLVRV